MSGELEIKRPDGALTEYTPPAERGQRIAALDGAAKWAAKIGDLEAFRIATDQKLQDMASAAMDYAARFPRGRPTAEMSEDRSDISRAAWLAEIGYSDKTVTSWAKWGDRDVREARVLELAKKYPKLLSGEIAANYSSESNEWYTPAVYVDAVRELYGGAIDLDPATSVKANQTVQAAHIFTLGDNALEQPWHGRAFLNPPYGTEKGESVAGMFCRKAIAEHEAGRLEACVILVNSVHSQKWQAPLYRFPVCFVDHRISFVNGEGQSNENPTFSNIFVYLGQNLDGFTLNFSGFGYVMVPA